MLGPRYVTNRFSGAWPVSSRTADWGSPGPDHTYPGRKQAYGLIPPCVPHHGPGLAPGMLALRQSTGGGGALHLCGQAGGFSRRLGLEGR